MLIFQYNQKTEDDVNSPMKIPRTTQLVLDQDEDGEPLVEVDKDIIKQLKPHQVDGMEDISITRIFV